MSQPDQTENPDFSSGVQRMCTLCLRRAQCLALELPLEAVKVMSQLVGRAKFCIAAKLVVADKNIKHAVDCLEFMTSVGQLAICKDCNDAGSKFVADRMMKVLYIMAKPLLNKDECSEIRATIGIPDDDALKDEMEKLVCSRGVNQMLRESIQVQVAMRNAKKAGVSNN